MQRTIPPQRNIFLYSGMHLVVKFQPVTFISSHSGYDLYSVTVGFEPWTFGLLGQSVCLTSLYDLYVVLDLDSYACVYLCGARQLSTTLICQIAEKYQWSIWQARLWHLDYMMKVQGKCLITEFWEARTTRAEALIVYNINCWERFLITSDTFFCG